MTAFQAKWPRPHKVNEATLRALKYLTEFGDLSGGPADGLQVLFRGEGIWSSSQARGVEDVCVCPEQTEEEEGRGGGGSWKRMQNKPSRQMVNTDQRECEEEGGERRAEWEDIGVPAVLCLSPQREERDRTPRANPSSTREPTGLDSVLVR